MRYRVIGWVVFQAIKRRRFLWLAGQAVRFIHVNLNKNDDGTWSLRSERMFHPANAKITTMMDDLHTFRNTDEVLLKRVSSVEMTIEFTPTYSKKNRVI